jgi:hypothetical protein
MQESASASFCCLSHSVIGRVAERIALAAWLMQPIGGEWRVLLEETRALG